MKRKDKSANPNEPEIRMELPRRSFLQTALAGGAVASTAYLSLTPRSARQGKRADRDRTSMRGDGRVLVLGLLA